MQRDITIHLKEEKIGQVLSKVIIDSFNALQGYEVKEDGSDYVTLSGIKDLRPPESRWERILYAIPIVGWICATEKSYKLDEYVGEKLIIIKIDIDPSRDYRDLTFEVRRGTANFSTMSEESFNSDKELKGDFDRLVQNVYARLN